MNRQPWPAGTPAHSIISSNVGTDNDDVVNTESQDLTALPPVRVAAGHDAMGSNVRTNGVLHLRVHGEPATVSLFTGIISDLDRK